MKRKYLIVLVVVALILLGLVLSYAKSKQNLKASLPEPTFPLNEEIIKTTLNEVGLKWNVKNPQSLHANSVVFMLYNEKLIGTIDSADRDGQKIMSIHFLPEVSSGLSIPKAIPKEDWQKVVSLASRLYGGFSNENKVYNKFIKDRSSWRYKYFNSNSIWDKKIDGVNCLIKLMPSEKNTEQLDLASLAMMNDLCYKDYVALMK